MLLLFSFLSSGLHHQGARGLRGSDAPGSAHPAQTLGDARRPAGGVAQGWPGRGSGHRGQPGGTLSRDPGGQGGAGAVPRFLPPRATAPRLSAPGHGGRGLGTVPPSGVASQVVPRLPSALRKSAGGGGGGWAVTDPCSVLQEGRAWLRPPLPRRALRRAEAAPGHRGGRLLPRPASRGRMVTGLSPGCLTPTFALRLAATTRSAGFRPERSSQVLS